MAARVRINQRELQAAQHKHRQVCLGESFAKPPAGKLLFCPPQTAQGCSQFNIFTAAADAEARPDLFWIHAGGFEPGSGSELLCTKQQPLSQEE